MTDRERAIVELYTGYRMLSGKRRKALWELAQELTGRKFDEDSRIGFGLRAQAKPLFEALAKEKETT